MHRRIRKSTGGSRLSTIAQRAESLSLRINWFVERICVALLVVLVLDVWLGVLVRYVIPLPLTFTEELARYLMIWMALLAVSSGIAHREHIGVEFVFGRLPAVVRRWLAVFFSALAFVFFLVLFLYGVGFAVRGFSRLTMIYGLPKGYPFLGVPLASLVACVQLALTAVHDFYADTAPDSTGASLVDPGED